MSRRSKAVRRPVLPDARYNSTHITMFINRMMYGGKRSTAMRLMYQALDTIQQRQSTDPLEVFEAALRNVQPAVEVKPRRVGGNNYLVPTEVPPYRALTLGMRWILESARKRSGRGMVEKLAMELMESAQGTSPSVKKRDDTHRMAEANRAFAHFR